MLVYDDDPPAAAAKEPEEELQEEPEEAFLGTLALCGVIVLIVVFSVLFGNVPIGSAPR